MNVTLEKHAPTRKRYARANQAPYMNKLLSKEIMKRSHFGNKFSNKRSDMNKLLSKEIMKRSHFRNKFSNKRSDLDQKAYNKQRNYIAILLKQEITILQQS